MNKQNPYESPNSPNAPRKYSAGRTALALILGILALPAAGIAFFATCASTYNFNKPEFTPWILGLLAGAAVGAPMIFLMIRLLRR